MASTSRGGRRHGARSAGGWLVALLSLLSGVVLFAVLIRGAEAQGTKGSANLFVSPGGGGSTCSQAAPCGSINAAYQKASPGDVIEMGGGTYGQQDIAFRTAASAWTSNVVVRPASGASVEIVSPWTALNIGSPRLTFRDIRVTGNATFNYNSHFSRFERVTVAGKEDPTTAGIQDTDFEGATTVIESNNISIVDSRLGPSYGNDSLKIAPGNGGAPRPTNTLVEGSELGPSLKDCLPPTCDQHLDTLQTHGFDGLTVRRNIFHEAASQTLNFGSESGPISDLLVENNLIEQCAPVRPVCDAYYAAGANAGTNIRFLNNTIKGGVYPENDTTYIGNIIDYAGCTGARPMRYNLIREKAWNSDATCSATNKVGTPIFAADGMHLAAGSPGIDLGVVSGSPSDYDQANRDATPDAGLDER